MFGGLLKPQHWLATTWPFPRLVRPGPRLGQAVGGQVAHPSRAHTNAPPTVQFRRERPDDRGSMSGCGASRRRLDMTLINSRPAILASFAETARETGTAIDLSAVNGGSASSWTISSRSRSAGPGRRGGRHLPAALPAAGGPDDDRMPGAHEALATVRAAGQRAVIIPAEHPVGPAEPAGRRTGPRRAVHPGTRAGEGGGARRLKAVAYVGDTPPTWPPRCRPACGRWGRDRFVHRRGPGGRGAEVVLDSLAAPRMVPVGSASAQTRAAPLPPRTAGAAGHEQRPGLLADPRPGGSAAVGLPPGARLVAADGGDTAGPARVRRPPPGRPGCRAARRRWPASTIHSRSAICPAASMTTPVTAALDAVHPALGAGTVPDAGRAEPGSDGQRGHRVAGLVPGCLHRCRPAGA